MCLIFIILIISRYAENVMPEIFSNSALTVNPLKEDKGFCFHLL